MEDKPNTPKDVLLVFAFYDVMHGYDAQHAKSKPSCSPPCDEPPKPQMKPPRPFGSSVMKVV